MTNYKRFFTSTIWRRGENYYRAWKVSGLKYDEDNDMCEAEVSGEEDYHVKIWLNKGEVIDMECDCPYALGGSNCKHMAAVLMEMEDEQIFQLSKRKKGDGNPWETVFSKYRKGYISKAKMQMLDTELYETLSNIKATLFKNIPEHLKSLAALFSLLAKYNDYRLPKTFATISDIFMMLVDSRKQTKEIYRWISEQRQKPQNYLIKQMMEQALFEKSKNGLRRLSLLIEGTTLEKEKSSLITSEINTMKALKMSDDEMIEAVKKHGEIMTSLVFMLESYMAREKYSEALGVIKIMKKKPCNNSIKNKIDLSLADIYFHQNDKSYYKKYVLENITDDNISYANHLLTKLKSMCADDAEWYQLVEEMKNEFSHLDQRDAMLKVFKDQKDTQALYMLVYDFNRQEELEKYKDLLIAYDKLLYQLLYIRVLQKAVDKNDIDTLNYAIYRNCDLNEEDFDFVSILSEILIYADENYPKRRKLRELIERTLEKEVQS